MTVPTTLKNTVPAPPSHVIIDWALQEVDPEAGSLTGRSDELSRAWLWRCTLIWVVGMAVSCSLILAVYAFAMLEPNQHTTPTNSSNNKCTIDNPLLLGLLGCPDEQRCAQKCSVHRLFVLCECKQTCKCPERNQSSEISNATHCQLFCNKNNASSAVTAPCNQIAPTLCD